MEKVCSNLVDYFSGPILTNYVWWILQEAIKCGSGAIYFLARDGYLLREIAIKFCKKFHLDIDCRYLYCSRTALRMPSYHLIGDEAMDLLLVRTQYATLASILTRVNLTVEEINCVCRDAHLEEIPFDQRLTAEELQRVENALRSSRLFREIVDEKSRSAYPSAIRYFRQEGLFDKENILIADSGWTGSMQRSLRQLLQSAGYDGKITGLYFGMYKEPKSPEDGDYLSWYFHAGSSFFDRIKFNNNLFECLLAAPHGMTVGYRISEDCCTPVLADPPSEAEKGRILQHIAAVTEFAEAYVEQIRFDAFDDQAIHRDTRRRIQRYMVYPTAEEARHYGALMFCDDVTEGYHRSLADPSQLEHLGEYLVLRRIWLKLTKKNLNTVYQGMYWPYGTMAFLPGWKRTWYRCNFYIWEWINDIRYT